MEYRLRVALWAAVSSDEQVEKASIPAQIEAGRRACLSLGGEEVGVYIADGYPRTGYFDLTQAARDIPPLKQCINDIQKYDVLVCKNYDRFGSLGMMLFNYFAVFNKQLYSVEQATPIFPPNEYNPNRHTGAALMIQMMGIPQIYRIAKITDAFATGIAKRVKEGKYAQRLPFGYVKVDKDTIKLDERVAPLLAKFPEWFLSGASTAEIAKRAQDSGVPSRRGMSWTPNVIKQILRSPFYAGLVYYGRGYVDKASGHYRYHKSFETFEGKHEKIWTVDTHHKIMAEFERRNAKRQTKRDYNFTGLLRCSVCSATLLIAYDSQRGTTKYWKCPNKHVHIRTDLADRLAASELVRAFSSDEPIPETREQAQDFTQRELAAVRRRLARLDQENDAGAYTPVEFAEKRKALRAREGELLDDARQKMETQRRQESRAESLETMKQLAAVFPEWIREEKPSVVKFTLAAAGIRFIVTPQKTLTIELN